MSKIRRNKVTWTPYRNLIFFAACRVHTNGMTKAALLRKATTQAKTLAQSGLPKSWVTENWITPEPHHLEAMRGFRISDDLRTFILRGRRRARKIFDRLILAYASIGHPPAYAVKEAYLDYKSIDNLLPLSEKDAFVYASLYWDFAALFDFDKGKEWLATYMPDSIEYQIADGQIGLDEIRSLEGVSRGINFEARQARLAMKGMRVLETMLDQLIVMDKLELVRGIEMNTNFGLSYSTDHLKSVASFMASTMPVTKQYIEINEEKEEASMTLQDLIALRVAEIGTETKALPEIQEYETLQDDDVSIEEVRQQRLLPKADKSSQ